jgi:hypothetical protein
MMALVALAPPAWSGETKCKMRYSLAGWSAGYSTASGSGTITCDNGQSARVSLRAKGGGITAGKSKTINGSGTFSEVGEIIEMIGSYTSAEVHDGARRVVSCAGGDQRHRISGVLGHRQGSTSA